MYDRSTGKGVSFEGVLANSMLPGSVQPIPRAVTSKDYTLASHPRDAAPVNNKKATGKKKRARRKVVHAENDKKTAERGREHVLYFLNGREYSIPAGMDDQESADFALALERGRSAARTGPRRTGRGQRTNARRLGDGVSTGEGSGA